MGSNKYNNLLQKINSSLIYEKPYYYSVSTNDEFWLCPFKSYRRMGPKALKILFSFPPSWLFGQMYFALTEINSCNLERLLGIDDEL